MLRLVDAALVGAAAAAAFRPFLLEDFGSGVVASPLRSRDDAPFASAACVPVPWRPAEVIAELFAVVPDLRERLRAVSFALVF